MNSRHSTLLKLPIIAIHSVQSGISASGNTLVMRTATFLLVALQALFVLALVISEATTRSDAAGQGMASAYAMGGAAVCVVFARPAWAVASLTGQQWRAVTRWILGWLVFLLARARPLRREERRGGKKW